MAAKGESTEQVDIQRENERADPKTKRSFSSRRIDKPKRFPNVDRKDDDKENSEIEKVAMHVLHDQRKRTLAEVTLPRFADGARRRIRPESLVIGAAIVVAGQPQSARRPENEQGRGKQKPDRPPGRLRAEPALRRIAKKLRRIKRREIRPEMIMVSLERRPRGINDKAAQPQKDQQRLRPPSVGPHRLAELARRDRRGCCV